MPDVLRDHVHPDHEASTISRTRIIGIDRGAGPDRHPVLEPRVLTHAWVVDPT